MPKFNDRTDEVRTMNNGLKAIIIAYQNNKNADVKFLESGIVIHGIRYDNFRKGKINVPLLIEQVRDWIVVSNINSNPITQFIISKEDISILQDKLWYIGKNGYIYSRFENKLKPLHRLIMNAKMNEIIDHVNGDKLDNRRCNLRFCTKSENAQNKLKLSNNASGYKGVSWHRIGKKWLSQIGLNGRNIYLGLYNDKISAARAYNEAAIKYHGEFAKLNEV